MKAHNTVDQYISANKTWQPALTKLRRIVLSTKLQETVKWGAPIYTYEGKNILGLAAFKSYVGLWFFQGALLSDKLKKLVNAQEGKTKALLQWRFNSEEEMDTSIILEYIEEAIQNQKTGKEIKPQKKPLVIPDQLREAINKSPDLKNAYELLGLTKQREFADYISEAKREETKMKRLDKITPLILEKKGLYDKYK